jgi:hypothetical protein
LRFGLEDDVLGHAGSGPANWIGRPILGKIEPKGDRQARVLVAEPPGARSKMAFGQFQAHAGRTLARLRGEPKRITSSHYRGRR